MVTTTELEERQQSSLRTPSDITQTDIRDIAAGVNALLADVFALYLRTKNFHWHMGGPQVRMLTVHGMCDDAHDVATASLIENWIDQGQRRIWFLFEATRA